MADRNNKHPLNVPGPFYNDDTCIDCGLCHESAPEFFRRDDASGMAYVWKQPQTTDEFTLAQEALEGCPTETIGSDGE
jgi:ferredoxin